VANEKCTESLAITCTVLKMLNVGCRPTSLIIVALLNSVYIS